MVVNHNSYDATGTNDSSFDMHFVKNDRSKVQHSNMVVKELPVAGGETFTFDSEKIILEAGDKINYLEHTTFFFFFFFSKIKCNSKFYGSVNALFKSTINKC